MRRMNRTDAEDAEIFKVEEKKGALINLIPRPPLHATERGRHAAIKSPLRVWRRMRSIRGIPGVR
jgi:hypothetical protein